jgi:hypothetical protein
LERGEDEFWRFEFGQVVEEQRPPGGGTDVCWGGRGVGHGVGAGVPEEGEEAAGGGGGGSYFEGWREARLTVSRLLGDRWRVRLTGMLETSVRTDKMNPSQLTLCRLKDPNWRSVILGWKSIYAVRCHDVVDTRLLPTPTPPYQTDLVIGHVHVCPASGRELQYLSIELWISFCSFYSIVQSNIMFSGEGWQ